MTAEQNQTAPDGAPPESKPEAPTAPSDEPVQPSAPAQAIEHTGNGESEDESEEDAGEGETSSEGTEGAALGPEGAKKKRRRRRRRKGGVRSASGATASPPLDGTPEAASVEGTPVHPPRERKEPHLPFQRFFEGRGHEGAYRGERRHAFAVGEIVAGRVVRLEHGASVIDLFGKATAFALENEPREVPIPSAAHLDDEAEERGAAADPSQVAGAMAAIEGAVGMPAAESLEAEPAREDRYLVMGPGPDGILGTDDDEPLSGQADPVEIARAARELSAVGTPSIEGVAPESSQRGAGALEGDASSAAGALEADSSAGAIEAAEESAAAEQEEQHPPLEVGAIFRGRIAAVAESGHCAIHNKLVTRAEARLKLAKAREEHRRVFGIVYGYNRGGFDVLVEGVRAFCPVSGMTLEHLEDPEALLGKRLEFSVQQAKSGHQGIVVSRRSILEREARKRAKELRRSLQPGQKIKGRVTQVREFGVFVDLGGVEGLVHLSELSWERGVKPGDVARPGDEIEVQVLKVTEPTSRKDRDGRIALSLKALQQDPWESQTQDLHEGNALKGKISRATEFGAFVEVAPGIDGLLHITELGKDLRHASERVKEGDEIHVVIERIDRKLRRISLSKMSAQDAKAFDEGALEVAASGKVVRPGAMLKVKVERVEQAGLHVQVEGVLGRRGRGFIPNAEMGTERGTDHRKKFPPGTEIDAKVIGLDRDGGLRLSRKAFAQDEERRAVQDYRKEAATKGFGTFGDLLKKKLKKI